jgi:hypothetical protein
VRAALAFAACLALPAVGYGQGYLSNAPYVPTPQSTVDRMLELAKVGPGDLVIDLGSGDGRIPITAAKRFGGGSNGSSAVRSVNTGPGAGRKHEQASRRE